ncbi:hypothetical protein F8388_017793 [Cannabis sativa]|uniref:Uncharacterized protein n=1 Tax=Cannabis sativa TaxID=3483 RepID=A0A7J6F3C1_CANSA|nr:hypothetical protein F8388_017793 [Cannabis sativa]
MPPVNLTRYNLTSFAITLNELTEGLQEKLPPTNSRLRPDQRYVENEDYEKANSDKQRLEKRQRMCLDIFLGVSFEFSNGHWRWVLGFQCSTGV